MFRLNFTSYVLGAGATEKLRRHEVTQTVRSKSSDIVVAVLNGYLDIGDPIEIFIDGEELGEAELSYWEGLSADELDEKDAQRGGFNTVAGIVLALRKAGYRFKALKDYDVFRVRFKWFLTVRTVKAYCEDVKCFLVRS